MNYVVQIFLWWQVNWHLYFVPPDIIPRCFECFHYLGHSSGCFLSALMEHNISQYVMTVRRPGSWLHIRTEQTSASDLVQLQRPRKQSVSGPGAVFGISLTTSCEETVFCFLTSFLNHFDTNLIHPLRSVSNRTVGNCDIAVILCVESVSAETWGCAVEKKRKRKTSALPLLGYSVVVFFRPVTSHELWFFWTSTYLSAPEHQLAGCALQSCSSAVSTFLSACSCHWWMCLRCYNPVLSAPLPWSSDPGYEPRYQLFNQQHKSQTQTSWVSSRITC